MVRRKWLVMRGGAGQAGRREALGQVGRPASRRVEGAGPCDHSSMHAGEGAETRRGG